MGYIQYKFLPDNDDINNDNDDYLAITKAQHFLKNRQSKNDFIQSQSMLMLCFA